jgi:hypothetical protein
MQNQTTIRCSNCGQPFNAIVRTLVDPSRDQEGKAMLLANQLNMAQCPQCGAVNTISTPLLYHDAEKELLVAYVPMELNLNKDGQERVIGDLLKMLPKENFKGYMFNPKRALTMQGLLELVLEADGITPEMIQAQRDRINLVQEFMDADPQQLPALIQQHDQAIDLQFVQTLSVMVQRLAQSGRRDIAEQIINVQNALMQFSTFGQNMLQQQAEQEQVVEEVAFEIENLGEKPQRKDFLALAQKYQDDEMRLQALVGLVRPVFDQGFFQEMTTAISKAPADERPDMEDLRDRLEALCAVIDQQAQMQIQNAVALLQQMLENPDHIDEIIDENLPLIDNTFMSVLTANIEEMERRQEINISARLKTIYEKVLDAMQSQMQPELQFVNQLLTADSEEAASQLVRTQAKGFGEPLLEVMDAVSDMLTAQGQAGLARRLSTLREEAAETIHA